MISVDEWNDICNRVFCVFIPPEDMIEKIICGNGKSEKVFNSVKEMALFFAMQTDDDYKQQPIAFVLKDTLLYEKTKKNLNKIKKKLKGVK